MKKQQICKDFYNRNHMTFAKRFIGDSEKQSPSQLSQEKSVKVKVPIYPQVRVAKSRQNNKKCWYH